jgi:hypothetical protein
MNNPVNWGETPLANSAVRGIIAAIITGVLYAIYGYQDGNPLDQSIMAGAIPMLLMFLGMLGYGVADSDRAQKGVVNAADVPVQIDAKIEREAPVVGGVADRVFARSPQQIAEEETRRNKEQLHVR